MIGKQTRDAEVVLAPTKPERSLRSAASHSKSPVRIPFPTLTNDRPLDFVKRRWVGLALFLTDAIALQLALILGFLSRMALLTWLPIGMGWRQYYVLSPLMMMVPLGGLLIGLYPGYGLGPVARLRRQTTVLVVLMGLFVLWQSEMLNVFLPDLALPRLAILLTMGFGMVLCPLGDSLVIRFLVRMGVWGAPTAIIGSSKAVSRIIKALREGYTLGWVPVAAFCDDAEAMQSDIEGVPLLGPIARARAVVGKIHIAVLGPPSNDNGQYVSMASRLRFRQIVIVPDMDGLPALGIRARDLGGMAGLEIHRNLLKLHNLIIKRILDYIIGSAMFVVSLPILAVAAFLIKRTSPGPAFFTQERIGLGGRRIGIWKLRTMYVDAETRLSDHLEQNPQARKQWDRFCKLKDDPRIIPGIGHFLRRTSLDELPQLWNILKGEMSLVGPRPFPAYHVSKFRRDFRGLRRRVLPGLTGLWQISARSNGDISIQQSLDTYYVHNWSLWLDIYICSRTVSVVWKGQGAY